MCSVSSKTTLVAEIRAVYVQNNWRKKERWCSNVFPFYKCCQQENTTIWIRIKAKRKSVYIMKFKDSKHSDCISHFLNKYKLKHFSISRPHNHTDVSVNMTGMIVYSGKNWASKTGRYHHSPFWPRNLHAKVNFPQHKQSSKNKNRIIILDYWFEQWCLALINFDTPESQVTVSFDTPIPADISLSPIKIPPLQRC